MKLLGTAKTLSMLLFAGVMAAAVPARADDLGSPPPPEPGASADWTEVNQVLEIPQQCDKDAVAMLCDRGESGPRDGDQSTAAAEENPDASAPADAQASAAHDNYGSIEDYQNQYATAETAAGALYVPVPVYVPARPMYFVPAPVVVNRPAAPGPHYLTPLPFGNRFRGGGRFRGR